MSIYYFALFLLVVALALWFVVRHYRRVCAGLRQTQTEYRRQREAVVEMLNRIGLRIRTSMDLDEALALIAEDVYTTGGVWHSPTAVGYGRVVPEG
jgi:hypothetical protein